MHCLANELSDCLKNTYSSRNGAIAVKATHNFANYNVSLSIAVIMTSLALTFINVAISNEFMQLQGIITWYYIVICTSACSVQNAAKLVVLILYCNKWFVWARKNSSMAPPHLPIGLS